MNSNPRSEFEPANGPLFVLRYRRRHSWLRIIVFAFGALLLGAIAFLVPYQGKFDIIFRPFMVLLFFASILTLIDLFLFEELRLYQDRIVLVRKLGVDREIELANAMWANTSTRGMVRKSVFDQDTNKRLAWVLAFFAFRGISYYEDLPDPQDVRKLNALLASWSGRRAEDIAQSWTNGKLIKEGSKPRVIDKRALDEALSQRAEPSDYDRSVNRALVVMALFVLLGAAVLVWCAIRLGH